MNEPLEPDGKPKMINHSAFDGLKASRHDDVVSAYLGGKSVIELQKMFPGLSESEIHHILAKGHTYL